MLHFCTMRLCKRSVTVSFNFINVLQQLEQLLTLNCHCIRDTDLWFSGLSASFVLTLSLNKAKYSGININIISEQDNKRLITSLKDKEALFSKKSYVSFIPRCKK